MRAKSMFRSILPFVTLLAGLAACTEDDVDGFRPDSRDESPKPTRYGALGNSLTAGFINGGLIQGGQVAAYPTRLAEQAGWDAPGLPLVDAPGIGSPNAAGVPQSALFVTAEGAITSTSLTPSSIPGLLLNATLPWPYDNLGVPGATTSDILNARSAATSQSGANLFFDLILRNSALPPGDWSPIEAMTARNPNALSVWVGSNDVLGGTLGGNPEVGTNLTPPSVFEALFLQIVRRIQAMSPSYVLIANVPDVTVIPYVTTVPLGTTIPGVGFVRWRMEEDMDDDGDDVVYLTLPASRLFGDPVVAATYLDPPFGTGTNTVSSNLTLTAGEVANVDAVVDDYNDIIAREAASNGWAVADVNTALAQLPRDPTIPATFAVPNGVFPLLPGPGGPVQNARAAFSLDGVHPSEVGQAVLTNLFASVLNEVYDLDIPLVEVNAVTNEVGWEKFDTGGLARAPGMEASMRGLPNFDTAGMTALERMVEAFLLAH